MSAVREFPSVTLTNNSNLVQINTNDSNFSVVPGSVIVVAGDRPRVVISGDTVNRTLTLSIAYIGDDIVEKSAALLSVAQLGGSKSERLLCHRPLKSINSRDLFFPLP